MWRCRALLVARMCVRGVQGVFIANQMLPRPESSDTDYYDLSDLTGQPLVRTWEERGAAGTGTGG